MEGVHGGTEVQDVTTPQFGQDLEGPTIKKCAVGTVQIAGEESLIREDELGVMAGDSRIGDAQFVVAASADTERLRDDCELLGISIGVGFSDEKPRELGRTVTGVLGRHRVEPLGRRSVPTRSLWGVVVVCHNVLPG